MWGCMCTYRSVCLDRVTALDIVPQEPPTLLFRQGIALTQTLLFPPGLPANKPQGYFGLWFLKQGLGNVQVCAGTRTQALWL